MADELRIDSHPKLDRPVLIAAFRGWNDGGQGASLAGAYLARAWDAIEFASIDPENFYDFQATRPTVALIDGHQRQIEWPENTFMYAALPGSDRDVIILLGVEPNLRWRTFSEYVTRVAKEFGVELVITLGSLLAAWAWRERARFPWLPRACTGLLGLLGLQMAIGETQYRTQLPWWLVLVHVTVAASVWAATAALVTSFFRPVAALARSL